MQTITQIIEAIRNHVNTDNDAPRLIIEGLKDVFDCEIYTNKEMEEAMEEKHDEIRELEAKVDKLERENESLEKANDKMTDGLDKAIAILRGDSEPDLDQITGILEAAV